LGRFPLNAVSASTWEDDILLVEGFGTNP